MKKIYIQPEALVIPAITGVSILAGSGVSNGDPVTNNTPESDDNENQFVKASNFWDD